MSNNTVKQGGSTDNTVPFGDNSTVDLNKNPEVLLNMIKNSLEDHTRKVEDILDNRLTGIEQFMTLSINNQSRIYITWASQIIMFIFLLLIGSCDPSIPTKKYHPSEKAEYYIKPDSLNTDSLLIIPLL